MTTDPTLRVSPPYDAALSGAGVFRRALVAPAGSLVARPHVRLVALSFLSLFLELTIIRWVPGSVRLVAYYANLMLISSFLGIGLGDARGTRLEFRTVVSGIARGGCSISGLGQIRAATL